MTQTQRQASVDRFTQVVARVLHVSASSVTDATSPQTVSGWDSLRSILLVSAVEEQFHVKLTLAQIMGIATVGDLKAALQRQGVDLDA